MLSRIVLDTLKSVLPRSDFIPLHEPCFSGNEWKYVKECLDSTFVSSVGKYVDHFEEMLSEYTGLMRAVAVVNGTAALHIALKLAGVRAEDEVIVPALTFVATANAVSYIGAIPHFVDSEETTLGLDPHKLDNYLSMIAAVHEDGCYNRQTGRRISAIVPVHIFGHPVDLDSLAELCLRFRLQMIEDAAEALGSFYREKHVGCWGKLSVFSFNGNKTVTTGGGGAILTSDEDMARHAKHITQTARALHKYEFLHDEVGYNYRMPNINAAIGCAQMEQLPDFLNKKRALAIRYEEAFKSVEGLQFFKEPASSRSNYWLNAILLDETHCDLRDEVLEKTNEYGIMTRPVWKSMHRLPMYENCPRMDLTVAESLEARLINIPSSATL